VFMNEISGMPDTRNKSGFRRLRGNKDSSDIIGTLKGGQACYIEVKTEKDRNKISFIWDYYQKNMQFPVNQYKLNKENMHILEQCDFLLRHKEKGAFAMFAFSLEDMEKKLIAI